MNDRPNQDSIEVYRENGGPVKMSITTPNGDNATFIFQNDADVLTTDHYPQALKIPGA